MIATTVVGPESRRRILDHPGIAALQQIAPYLRTGDPLPAAFTVPIVREERKTKLVASYGSTKVAEFDEETICG